MFPVQPLSLLRTDSYGSINEILFSDLCSPSFVDWNCRMPNEKSPLFLCERGCILQTHSFSDQITWTFQQSLSQDSINPFSFCRYIRGPLFPFTCHFCNYKRFLILKENYVLHLIISYVSFRFKRLQNVIEIESSGLKMQYQRMRTFLYIFDTLYNLKRNILALEVQLRQKGLYHYLHLYDFLRIDTEHKKSHYILYCNNAKFPRNLLYIINTFLMYVNVCVETYFLCIVLPYFLF